VNNKSLWILIMISVNHLSFAWADDVIAPVAAEVARPNNEFTFNLGGTTDYRYRGISQSNLNPALQGGADYTNNPTGLYAGTWLSSIKWITDVGGNDDVEWDLYAGKKGDIASHLSYDAGVLSYVYPSNNLGHVAGFVNANTTELYGQLTYKVVNLKYSHAFTNLFGVPTSKGSTYIDLWSSIDISDGFSLGLHAGHQKVENNDSLSYSDWKVGVTRDFYDISFILGVVGTNANKTLYVTPDGKFSGKTSLVLSASKPF